MAECLFVLNEQINFAGWFFSLTRVVMKPLTISPVDLLLITWIKLWLLNILWYKLGKAKSGILFYEMILYYFAIMRLKTTERLNLPLIVTSFVCRTQWILQRQWSSVTFKVLASSFSSQDQFRGPTMEILLGKLTKLAPCTLFLGYTSQSRSISLP